MESNVTHRNSKHRLYNTFILIYITCYWKYLIYDLQPVVHGFVILMSLPIWQLLLASWSLIFDMSQSCARARSADNRTILQMTPS